MRGPSSLLCTRTMFCAEVATDVEQSEAISRSQSLPRRSGVQSHYELTVVCSASCDWLRHLWVSAIIPGKNTSQW